MHIAVLATVIKGNADCGAADKYVINFGSGDYTQCAYKYENGARSTVSELL